MDSILVLTSFVLKPKEGGSQQIIIIIKEPSTCVVDCFASSARACLLLITER